MAKEDISARPTASTSYDDAWITALIQEEDRPHIERALTDKVELEIDFAFLSEEYAKMSMSLSSAISFLVTELESLLHIDDKQIFNKEVLYIFRMFKKIEAENPLISIFVPTAQKPEGEKTEKPSLERVLKQLFSIIKKIMWEVNREGTKKILAAVVSKLPLNVRRIELEGMIKQKLTLEKFGIASLERHSSLGKLLRLSSDSESKEPRQILARLESKPSKGSTEKSEVRKSAAPGIAELDEMLAELNVPPAPPFLSPRITGAPMAHEAESSTPEIPTGTVVVHDAPSPGLDIAVGPAHPRHPDVRSVFPPLRQPSVSSSLATTSSSSGEDETELQLLSLISNIKNFSKDVPNQLNEDLKDIRAAMSALDGRAFTEKFVLFLQHYFKEEVKEKITTAENLEILINNLNFCLEGLDIAPSFENDDAILDQLAKELSELGKAARGYIKIKVQAVETDLLIANQDAKNSELKEVLDRLQNHPFLNVPSQASPIEYLRASVADRRSRYLARRTRVVSGSPLSPRMVSPLRIEDSLTEGEGDKAVEALIDELSVEETKDKKETDSKSKKLLDPRIWNLAEVKNIEGVRRDITIQDAIKFADELMGKKDFPQDKKVIFVYPANSKTAALSPHKRYHQDSGGLGEVFEGIGKNNRVVANHGIPTIDHSKPKGKMNPSLAELTHYIAQLYTYAAQGHLIVLPAVGDLTGTGHFAFGGKLAPEFKKESKESQFLQNELKKFRQFIFAYNGNFAVEPDKEIYKAAFKAGLEMRDKELFRPFVGASLATARPKEVVHTYQKEQGKKEIESKTTDWNEIEVIGRGNCAFNAAILSMADAIVAGGLDIQEKDTKAVKTAKKTAQQRWIWLYHENKMNGKEDWNFDNIKQYLTSLNTYELQKNLQDIFAPILRDLIQYILSNPDKKLIYKENLKPYFLGAYANYANREYSRQPLDDIFIACPAIKARFEEWDAHAEEDVNLAKKWDDELAEKFILHIGQEGKWVGDAELGLVFEELGFYFEITGRGYVYDATPNYGIIIATDFQATFEDRAENIIELLLRSEIIRKGTEPGTFELIANREILERRLSVSYKDYFRAYQEKDPKDMENETQIILFARKLIERTPGLVGSFRRVIKERVKEKEFRDAFEWLERKKGEIIQFYDSHFVERPVLHLINRSATHWTCKTREGWLKKPATYMSIKSKKEITKKESKKTSFYMPSMYDVGIREGEQISYFRFMEDKNMLPEIIQTLIENLNDDFIKDKLKEILLGVFEKIEKKEIEINESQISHDLTEAYKSWEHMPRANRKNFELDANKEESILEWLLTHIGQSQLPGAGDVSRLYFEYMKKETNIYLWQKQPDRTIALIANITSSSIEKVASPSAGIAHESDAEPLPAIHLLETKNEEEATVLRRLHADKVRDLIYATIYSLRSKPEFSEEKCEVFADWRQIYFAIELMIRLQVRKNNYYKTLWWNQTWVGHEKYGANIENQKNVIEELFETGILGLPFLEQRPDLVFNMLNLRGYIFDPSRHQEYFSEYISKLYYLWMAFKEIENLGHVGRHAEHPRKLSPSLERAKSYIEAAVNHADYIDYFTALDFAPNIKDKPSEHQERNSELTPKDYRELAILEGHLQVCRKHMKIEVHTRSDQSRFWWKNSLFTGIPAAIGAGMGAWGGVTLGDYLGFGAQLMDYAIFEVIGGFLGGVAGASLLGVAGYYGISRRIWHKRHIVTKAEGPIIEGEPVEFFKLGNLSEPTKKLIRKATGLAPAKLEEELKRGQIELRGGDLAGEDFPREQPKQYVNRKLTDLPTKPELPKEEPPRVFQAEGSPVIIESPENVLDTFAMRVPHHIRPSRQIPRPIQHIPLVAQQHDTIRMGQAQMHASGVPLAHTLYGAKALADALAGLANLALPQDEQTEQLSKQVAADMAYLQHNPELLSTTTGAHLSVLLERYSVRFSSGLPEEEGDTEIGLVEKTKQLDANDLKGLKDVLNELPFFIPLELDRTETTNDQWKGILRRLKKLEACFHGPYVKKSREQILNNHGDEIEKINKCIRQRPRNIDDLSHALRELENTPLIRFALQGHAKPIGIATSLGSGLSAIFRGGSTLVPAAPSEIEGVIVESEEESGEEPTETTRLVPTRAGLQ